MPPGRGAPCKYRPCTGPRTPTGEERAELPPDPLRRQCSPQGPRGRGWARRDLLGAQKPMQGCLRWGLEAEESCLWEEGMQSWLPGGSRPTPPGSPAAPSAAPWGCRSSAGSGRRAGVRRAPVMPGAAPPGGEPSQASRVAAGGEWWRLGRRVAQLQQLGLVGEAGDEDGPGLASATAIRLKLILSSHHCPQFPDGCSEGPDPPPALGAVAELGTPNAGCNPLPAWPGPAAGTPAHAGCWGLLAPPVLSGSRGASG